MALSRQRLLTLVHGDMETVRMVCARQISVYQPFGSCDASQAPKHVCGTVLFYYIAVPIFKCVILFGPRNLMA